MISPECRPLIVQNAGGRRVCRGCRTGGLGPVSLIGDRHRLFVLPLPLSACIRRHRRTFHTSPAAVSASAKPPPPTVPIIRVDECKKDHIHRQISFHLLCLSLHRMRRLAVLVSRTGFILRAIIPTKHTKAKEPTSDLSFPRPIVSQTSYVSDNLIPYSVHISGLSLTAPSSTTRRTSLRGLRLAIHRFICL